MRLTTNLHAIPVMVSVMIVGAVVSWVAHWLSDPKVMGSNLRTVYFHIMVQHQPSASRDHWRSAHCQGRKPRGDREDGPLKILTLG